MSNRIISIADDYSRFPGGRWRKDGPYSGEQFRDDLLLPALMAASARQDDKVIVDLDGVAGYSSSFLEESFGGAVRDGRVAPSIIARILEVRSKDPIYAGYHQDALRYFRDALDAARAAA